MLPVDPILRFFADHGRDLPWRGPDVTPWAVMVSEFMLQQTPVARVLPVFESWTARWPTPADLAADSPGDAVRAWGRLGYPRRALRLHACATELVLHHGGRVPADVDQLLALPGIGDYTARAIAAFAFGHRVPVVDTNVRRVLNRLVRGNTDAGAATPADRVLMESLLPAEPSTAARLSAAVMELGALVCTASAPDCPSCPVVSSCAWVTAGRPESQVRRSTQAWAGTDRQARGRIMALLRDSPGPVPRAAINLVWEPAEQRERCLASLVTDKLAVLLPDGTVGLPS